MSKLKSHRPNIYAVSCELLRFMSTAKLKQAIIGL